MLIEAGCLNGGGQIKPISGQSPKALSQLLESVYMENVSIILDEVALSFFKKFDLHKGVCLYVLMRTSKVKHSLGHQRMFDLIKYLFSFS